MNKLMTLMLGTAMVLGTTAFAADTPATDTTKKPAATTSKTKIKKHKSKKTDAVKPSAAAPASK